ncbi:ankyrin repeat domain-containing protein [Noviherbaspirillum pedocola]|uniref:Ankyrin repeat domain-containing protein n=1 Tax=Noviherbaspirillum pedocola TaxID=2801341 RepID=A0A934T013_9BURK|nr:ankyrin repeat domain-containing protein [Noviherbaspirillum pedocola]MBK4738844.1 ankyrin repeat domain-containing protein [Noviherbaspirillum pedocola]
MDNINSNSPYNQHNQHNQRNPNIPPQPPANPPRAAPNLHQQALLRPVLQQQRIPLLPPTPGTPLYPPRAQPATPPVFLNQQPQFSGGPKRTTPESGLDPRPAEETKRGRTMSFTPAAPMQPLPLHPAGSLSAPASSHFHPGASFPYGPGLPMHTGQGMSSASTTQTPMPDVTPQIFECERVASCIRSDYLPVQMKHIKEGKPFLSLPALRTAVLLKDVDQLRMLLANSQFNLNERDDNGCTVLHYAAAMGMTKLVEALAKRGIDPDVRDHTGRTALHYAVLGGKAATTVALLAVRDIDINLEIRDQTGQTALMLAVKEGNTAIVDALLENPKIRINVCDENDYTPLLIALQKIYGHTEEYQPIVDALLSREEINVRACSNNGNNALMLAAGSAAGGLVRGLLDMKAFNINDSNDGGKTALIIASSNGYETIMRMLLDTDGVDINAPDKNGNTALMKAANSCCIDAVRMLLNTRGIDINAKNKKGETAFDLAVEDRFSTLAALLFASADRNIAAAGKSNNAALALAAAKGDIAAVQGLLAKADIDVNASAAGNLTPLMLAAANGHESVLQALLKAPDINVNIQGIFDSSALMLAARNGHTAIVNALLDVDGIEINALDNDCFTALMWAAEFKHDTVVESLLAKPGINVNIIGQDEHSALGFVTRQKNLTVMKLLLATPTINVRDVVQEALWPAIYQRDATMTQLLLAFPGIDINARLRHEGRTALMVAAKNGDEATVRSLLAMPDTDINTQDRDKKTALMLAAEEEHDSIVRALLAMPDIRLDLKDNFQGRTALELAKQGGHDKVVSALQNHILPAPHSSVRLQKTLQILFASARGIADLSVENADKLDNICERLESGKCAAAEIPALFAAVTPMGDAASEAFVRSLAFGVCTGSFRNAAGQLDETIGIFHNAQGLRAVYDATVFEISAAPFNIDLHRIARSNLLGIAAREGNVRMIRGLVRLGAHVNLPSPNGKTALAIAVERKDWAACAELISHGALPTLPISDGRPALYHIVEAFGSDDANKSIALLMRYLRIKGVTFDILVQNPDPAMRETQPVVMLNDLLARKVKAWGKFAHIVYGLENAAPSSGTVPGSTADTSSSLADTSRNTGAASHGKLD